MLWFSLVRFGSRFGIILARDRDRARARARAGQSKSYYRRTCVGCHKIIGLNALPARPLVRPGFGATSRLELTICVGIAGHFHNADADADAETNLNN